MSRHQETIDPVLRLALRIARRADDLAQREAGAMHALEPWLRAEEEILQVRLPRPALASAAARRDASACDAVLSSR